MALLGWVLNVGQLYWMAVALFALPGICKRYAAWEGRGVTVSRVMPPAGDQGDVVEVQLRAENPTSIPRINLSLRDVIPAGLQAMVETPLPVSLPPGRSDTVQYGLRLARRGVHTVPSIELESSDLLGLAPHVRRIPLATEIIVYPRTVELAHELLPLDRGGGSAPIEASREKGEGSGFFGIREYRPGDPLRHVHWPTTARLDRLAVIEWEAEQSTDTILALDTRASAVVELDDGSTLDLAAGVAASLGKLIMDRGDTLELLVPGQHPWTNSRGSGNSMATLLEQLARTGPSEGSDLAALLRDRSARLVPGVLVAILTARGDERLIAACKALLGVRAYVWVYALASDHPDLAPGWSDTVGALENLGVHVAHLHRSHETVRLLLG